MKDLRLYLAEFAGTFFLVFWGTAAVAVDAITGGKIGHLGICLTFGFLVLAMIYTLGDISGAHLNPAVTIGFFFSRLIGTKHTFFFIIFQFLGALAASFTLNWLLPNAGTLGETIPSISLGRNFFIEFFLTFLLMFVIVNLSYGSKQKGITSGIAVGATVTLACIIGAPLTGASMNPARTLGPALISGTYDGLWIYLTAPFLGASIAVAFYSYIFATDADKNRVKIKDLFKGKKARIQQ